MLFYKLIGKLAVPCSMDEWMIMFADTDKRRVALDCIGLVEVSTVFIGIDRSVVREGGALLFETMVFGLAADDTGNWTRRYVSWDEAERGHAVTVDAVRELVAAANASLRGADK